MPAHYDDPAFSYTQYWQERGYEHDCEVTGLNRLLGNRRFQASADVGGGFGRLPHLLSSRSDQTFLVEPSIKQRSLAKKHLSSLSHISILPGNSQNTRLPDQSLDLVMMIRVMHHLPHPEASFAELYRILKPSGLLIIEFANSSHFKARLASLITGQPILPIPIERRSIANIRRHTIPFVNHHPQTIVKLLHRSGFRVVSTLSVSNFRSPFLKKVLPLSALHFLESISQSFLAKFYFGPSIFVLAQRLDKLNAL